MKIQTMSVVVGTNACNAHCPFCVSRLTNSHSLPTNVNWRNFEIACKLADKAGATTVLLTGKGEPTLYPELIDNYLAHINNRFPFIELQTNGMNIGNGREEHWLPIWYNSGLTTICLSAVEIGYANKKIYGDDYDLEKTIGMIRDNGFTVRLSIMMMKHYISLPQDIDRLVDFCKQKGIKQLTVRPISKPDFADNEVAKYVEEHTLTEEQLENIRYHITTQGTPVLHLAHGAVVYDYKGQNLCLSNCLTTDTTDDNMRQIIFYPDGTISYSWCYNGAVLL